ncbi:MAG: tryptophan synthase subunit alpha [Patescibacteria group bacterium]
MNTIENQIQKIKKSKKMGLMTHVIVGYPTLLETKKIVRVMAEEGVDFVELQIPFSDPLADGPTIMQACEESLAHGTKVKDAFDLVRSLAGEIGIPLLFMAYYNTVFRYGVEKFCRDAAVVGISGLIVPDMPIDEESHEHFYALCKKYDLHAIHVISPASTDERLRKNAAMATGFIYATARQGTTDATKGLAPEIATFLKRVKKYLALPLAVGFGISSKERVKMIAGQADVAVIGSAIVDIIRQSSEKEREKEIRHFLRSLNVVK